MEEEVKKSNVVATIIKSLLYVIVYIIIQLAVTFIYEIKIVIDYISEYGEKAIENMDEFMNYVTNNMNMNIVLLLSVIITMTILLIIAKSKKENIKDFFSFYPINKKIVLPLILLGISINFIIDGILSLLSNIPQIESILLEYSNRSTQLVGDNVIFNILVIAILVPILEELIYRALPIKKLLTRLSPIAAVIITSIAFGLSHGQIIWIVYTMIFGIVLGALFLKYKSSIANIVVHSALNLTSVILSIITIDESIGTNMLAWIFLGAGIVLLVITCILLKNFDKKGLAERKTNNEAV